MKEIYLIRHAQTDYNKKGIIQGSEVDSEIDEEGIKQSKLFYDYYKNYNFEKIYISNLKRTFLTVKEFINDGIIYEKLSEFNEISWGINKGKSDDLDVYKRLTDSWAEGNLNNKFKGGESPNEIAVRLNRGISHIINEKFNNIYRII